MKKYGHGTYTVEDALGKVRSGHNPIFGVTGELLSLVRLTPATDEQLLKVPPPQIPAGTGAMGRIYYNELQHVRDGGFGEISRARRTKSCRKMKRTRLVFMLSSGRYRIPKAPQTLMNISVNKNAGLWYCSARLKCTFPLPSTPLPVVIWRYYMTWQRSVTTTMTWSRCWYYSGLMVRAAL